MLSVLSGLRVIDLSRFVAGPFCTSLLGDLGAEVIKIEDPGNEKLPGGDGSRYYNEMFGHGMSSYFVGLNRNKKSVVLDIRSDRGREILIDLIREADVLISNYRPGVMERLGLGYEAMQVVNERLVYVSVSAFGEDGPYRSKAGMDGILQAMGGIMGLTGERDGGPVRIGAAIADYTGAFLAVAGTALALYERERTGTGRQVSIALLDGQVAMLANLMPGFAVNGKPDSRLGTAHQQIEPSRIYSTKDGHIVVSALTEQFWRNFATSIDLAWLIEDERFTTNGNRVENKQELTSIIQERLSTRTSAEWTELFDRNDVPCAQVNLLKDVLTDPQVHWNDMLRQIELADGQMGTVVGNPLGMGKPGSVDMVRAPLLGEHTREVLQALCKLSDADLDQLEADHLIK